MKKVINVHSHFNLGTPYDTQESEVYTADLDKLWKIERNAGVSKMFCTSFSSVLHTATVEEDNERLYRMTRETEDLYQWVVVDPRNERTFRQASKMLQDPKCVGIKIHPTYHGYALADYAKELLSFASDHQAILLTHPETDADYILPFADAYPEVTFIVAHLGSFRGAAYADAIVRARHRNVYTDTSGIASSNNRVIEYTVERAGSDRILFGTDTYAAGFQRGRIDYACISEADKDNILFANARRLFGISL